MNIWCFRPFPSIPSNNHLSENFFDGIKFLGNSSFSSKSVFNVSTCLPAWLRKIKIMLHLVRERQLAESRNR